ncbi:MAG: transposase family protein [Pirellulaceae bacterium]
MTFGVIHERTLHACNRSTGCGQLWFFDDLPDPPSKVNRLHRLGDVIVIAICAVIATADGPTAIAKWATLNKFWLRRHLALPNGILAT